MYKLFTTLIFIAFVTISSGKENNLYVVFLNTNPDRAQLDSTEVARLQQKHLNNISRLYAEGKIVAAGPFEGGGGIFIMSTASEAEADSLLNTDPAINAHRFNIELFPWNQRIGGICNPGKNYEMTTYTFIRYHKPHDPDDTSGSTQTFFHSLEEICKENIIAEGNFHSGGGILILNAKPENAEQRVLRFFNSHELTTSVKSLWIPKGTFCE